MLLAATWHVAAVQQAHPAAGAGNPTHPGARALLTGAVEPAPLLPPPVAVLEDWVRIERWDCTPMAGFPMDVCAQPLHPACRSAEREDAKDRPVDDGQSPHDAGVAEAAADPAGEEPVEPPARRIVVVGDSHAQQLTGALLPIAEQNNWQIVAIIRGACPFSTSSETVPDDPDCLA